MSDCGREKKYIILLDQKKNFSNQIKQTLNDYSNYVYNKLDLWTCLNVAIGLP